jgi:CRP-like cAMP-binding protein
MAKDIKLEALRNSPLAKELADDECEVLAKLISFHELKDGEILVREGESDSNLYVVVDGTIAVAKQDAQDNWTTLHTLGKGDLVGELSFMDDEPRYACLRAQGPTQVFSLNRGKFETLLKTKPKIVYKTMRAIMRVVHGLQRRMSMHLVELQNYIYKTHGKY